jgi:hypothetical protein
MATAYITKALNKLGGALFADVSSATTVVTAREDAVETAKAVADRITYTQSFAETTAADAALSGAVLPMLFNGEIVSAKFTVETGEAGGTGNSDFVNVVLYSWDADGDGTTTVGTWSGKTDTVTIKTSKAIPLTATAAKVVAGGSIQFQLTKTGDGATTGVLNCAVMIRREDD